MGHNPFPNSNLDDPDYHDHHARGEHDLEEGGCPPPTPHDTAQRARVGLTFDAAIEDAKRRLEQLHTLRRPAEKGGADWTWISLHAALSIVDSLHVAPPDATPDTLGEGLDGLGAALDGASRVVVETDHVYREVGQVVAVDVERREYATVEARSALLEAVAWKAAEEAVGPDGSLSLHRLALDGWYEAVAFEHNRDLETVSVEAEGRTAALAALTDRLREAGR